MTKTLNAVIVGASGYTGAELIRLLTAHPQVKITALTAEKNAGKALGESYPHLAHLGLPALVRVEDVTWEGVDVAFCCLPHGTTQEVVAKLPAQVVVIDVSADFRLDDLEAYKHWYGHPHAAPDLQKQAVYGLTEINRAAIAKARLIACPGCYPTSILLPLLPLVEAGVIGTEGIIADSKSGITGAGRAAKEANLFAEINEGMHAYSIASHRHTAEIDQELAKAAGKDVQITFTPQVVPMNRGILSTLYVPLKAGKTAADLRQVLEKRYANEAFVQVLPEGKAPSTREVRCSNLAIMGVFADRHPGRAIVVSVIDNLTKGASGQAVQNMNLRFSLPEAVGLPRVAVFP